MMHDRPNIYERQTAIIAMDDAGWSLTGRYDAEDARGRTYSDAIVMHAEGRTTHPGFAVSRLATAKAAAAAKSTRARSPVARWLYVNLLGGTATGR